MKLKNLVATSLVLAGFYAPRAAMAQDTDAPPTVTAPTITAPTVTVPAAPDGAAPDPVVVDTFGVMMGAIADDSYAAFLGSASDAVKAALPKPAFEAVVAQVGPRIKKGYTPRFLDSVQHGAIASYLWKIKFADGGDQMIVLMTLQDEKVAAFVLF